MQAGNLEVLKISDILPNRFQPRIKFDDESLNQLAISIARFGVIEPIVVRPTGKKYEIIAGERRFKASKLAGMSTIPCMIVDLSDKDSEELALLENVQRKALSPIEEAVSYKRILDSGYISRDELSKKIGKPQSLIFSKIKLLELSDEVQNYLLNNKISERHARSLLQLSNLSEQNEMLYRIVNERLTVMATDREIDKILKNKRKVKDSHDDTESLFDDERGKEKMDIDKIMQEAKDINPQEETKTPQGPNLMASGMDKPSELLGSHEDTPKVEPGKFVSVSQPASPVSGPISSTPTGLDFNNMFVAPINDKPSQNLDDENVTNGPIVSNDVVDNDIPDINTLMTGVTPLVQSTSSSSPELPLPMNEKYYERNNGSAEGSNSFISSSELKSDGASSSPSVFEQPQEQASVLKSSDFSSDFQPVTAALNSSNPFNMMSPGVSDSNLTSQVTDPVNMMSPGVSGPNLTSQVTEPVNMISPGVSDPNLTSQVTESVNMMSPGVSGPNLTSQVTEPVNMVSPGVSDPNLTSQVTEPVNMVSPGVSDPNLTSQVTESVNMMSPGVSDPNLTSQVTESVNMMSPGVSDPNLNSQVTESVNMMSPGVSDPNLTSQVTDPVNMMSPGVSGPNNTFGSVETIPEVNVSSMNLISPSNITSTTGPFDGVIKNGNSDAGQSISDAVSDAFRKVNNVPDVNIYQDSGDVSNITNENVVSDGPVVPDYVKVVQMLRECADDIQKKGYFVGVEELDVDGKYKVIFTIDK